MTAMSAQSASAIDAANPFPDLPAILGTEASAQPARPRGPSPRSYPRPRFGDYSRTRFESRLLFGDQDENEDAEEVATPTRQFSLLEITSGLTDDSREADEQATARHLVDLRGRVKAARAVASRTPGLAEILGSDWHKAARFYARFGITETLFRNGAPANMAESGMDFLDPARTRSMSRMSCKSERGRHSLSDAMICATEPIERSPGAWAHARVH